MQGSGYKSEVHMPRNVKKKKRKIAETIKRIKKKAVLGFSTTCATWKIVIF